MAKISELIKILKGEGNAAAVRRAERIGDEAPYAAERIDADTLRSALSRGDNAASLAIIKPEDFRYLAQQLHPNYLDMIETPKIQAPKGMPVREYIRELGSVAKTKGFDDIPFLEYGQIDVGPELSIKGHEGRHRMRALENLGDEKSLVRLLPRADVREDLPRRSRSEFLEALAEKYGLPLRLLPEDFKDRAPLNAEGSEIENLKRTVQPFQAGGIAKFFSAVDEAVANLRQKKGTGEQMLKEIQKSPNVKKEELELRRLPERLAGQQKVTQEDIQAMLQAVPAPKVKLTQRGGKGLRPTPPDLYNWVAERPNTRGSVVDALESRGYEITQNPEDPQTIGFISPDGDIVGLNEIEDLLYTERRMAVNERVEASRAYQLADDNVANMFDVDGELKPEFRDQIQEANRVRDNLMQTEREARERNQSVNETLRELQRFMGEWQSTVTGAAQTDAPKFENFTTKGPKENYRELLIQLERPPRKKIERPPFAYNRQGLGGDPIEVSPEEAVSRLGLTDADEIGYDAESVLFYPTGSYIVKRKDGKYYSQAFGEEIIKKDLGDVETWLATKMEGELQISDLYEPQPKAYRNPSHFPEEDILVHARVDDRVGPNGEKILYVEEIQSDWHQDARKARLEEAKKRVDKGSVQGEIADAARLQVRRELGLPEDVSIPPAIDNPEVRQRFKEVFGEIEDARINEEAAKLPKDFGYKQMGTRTPPFSQTSHELAVKQILDTAANEGYDKVMFSPGSEQVKRYSLGEYLDELQVNSVQTRDGTFYNLSGVSKDGSKINRRFSKKELIENIGEDKAKLAIERIEENKAAGSTAPALLTGDDLLLGGKKAQGKLKIYDEIIPGFASKYAGKEFNVQPGRTSVEVDPRDVDQMRRDFRSEQYKKKLTELKDLFDQGGMDPESEVEFMSVLDDAARKAANIDFREGRAGREFIEEFAPVDEQGFIDVEKLVREELDPSSFSARLAPTDVGSNLSLSRLDPFKAKFKDPVKQEKFDDWLYGVVVDRSTDPDFVDREFGVWGQKRAQDIINAMGEDLYKDMPPPQRLEGTSFDITPEMREKIKTRGQPLFVVPPAVGAAAALTEEEEPVQEFKEAGRVEKKLGMAKEQFDPPFDESRRIGPKPGLSKGPASIRSLTKILRGEDTEAKNLERQRIEGNLAAGRGLGEYMYDMVVPQAPWELAAEAAFFPVPRPVRKVAIAMAGGLYDPDAEAGRLRLLHGSPSKLDRLEEGRELYMTTDPEYALKRGFDKMRMARGAQGPAMVNQFGMEDTELMRLTDKYSPEDIEIARRAFSKLPQGREVTGEEIYEIASTNTGGAKAAALENVTRALGKKGYQVQPGADDKGDWYRVLDQTDLEPYGKGGIVDAIKNAMKMTDAPPDLSRRKAIGLREQISQPGALTTIEKEVSASDLDTLQKAMGNVGQAILNEPVSRREVLKRGALSAASNLVPGGGVLPQLVKEFAPQALKAATNMPSNEALTAMLAKSIGQKVAKIPDANLDDVIDTYPMIQELEPLAYFGDLRYDDDALDSVYEAIGLRTQNLANELQIPQEKLYELFGTRKADKKNVRIGSIEELVQPFGDLSEHYRFILDDGRPKEAVRDTSLLDNWNKWARASIKEILAEKDNIADDLEFVQKVQDRMFNKFLTEELANAGLGTGKEGNPIIDALAEELRFKDKAREVFTLALGDDYISSWGHELNNRAIEAFNSGELGRFAKKHDFDDLYD